MSVTGGEEKGPGPAAGTSRSSPNPDHASEPSSQEAPEDHETEEGTTPDQEARPESEERVKALLRAYQETLDTVEALPAMVWVPWDSKRPGRYFKVPYLRWFLKDFVVHHIGRSLDTLDRRYHAIAARSGDLDANGANREAVKLYLQSLPRLPYRVLIFTAVLAALVIALPLKSFGNVFYVLDLIGATLRFDVGYVGRALQRNELGPTVRALIVLLIGLIVVAGLITSPFGLKRILFNLHPWASERLDSTAARGHGLRAEGIYALEDEVFEDAGIRRPHEGRWDLAFQTFLLSFLLVFELLMAGFTFVIFMSWNVNLKLDTGAPADVNFFLPKLSWAYFALFTVLVLAACFLLFKRLIIAWKKRSRRRSQTPPGALM